MYSKLAFSITAILDTEIILIDEVLSVGDINFREKSYEKMKEIIADQLGVSEDEVTLEASFKEDLDADSLDLFELVMALEEEYDVEIPSDDLAELNTVGDVINYLKDKGVED